VIKIDKILLIIIVLFSSSFVISSEEYDFVREYNQNNFDEALRLLESKNPKSYSDFYNMALISYKSGLFQKSFFYAILGLNLSPFDKNLALILRESAKEMAMSIEDTETIINGKKIILFIPYYILFAIVFISALSFFISAVLYLKKPGTKRVVRVVAVISILIVIMGFTFSLLQYNEINRKFALIIKESSLLLVKDDPESTICRLNQGYIVNIIKKEGDYIKVSDKDNRIGWMKTEDALIQY